MPSDPDFLVAEKRRKTDYKQCVACFVRNQFAFGNDKKPFRNSVTNETVNNCRRGIIIKSQLLQEGIVPFYDTFAKLVEIAAAGQRGILGLNLNPIKG